MRQTSKIDKNLLDEIELLSPFLCSQEYCQRDDPVVYFDAPLDKVAYLKFDVGVDYHHYHHH